MTALVDPLADLGVPVLTGAVLLLMVLDTTAIVGLLVPSDALIMTASSGVGPAAAPLVAAAAIAGTLTGWSLSWWLGRRFGGQLRYGTLGRRVGEQRWATAERLLNGGGGRVLLVVQFLPVVNALIPLLAGTLRMPYGRFIRLASISTVAWAITYSLLGTLSASAGSAMGGGPLVGLLVVGLPGLLVGSLVLARLGSARGATGASRWRAENQH